METKELIDALRNEDETDVSAMMAYMEMAADRLEGMQKQIANLESVEPTLVNKSVVFEPWNHSAYVRAIIEWHGKTTILNIPPSEGGGVPMRTDILIRHLEKQNCKKCKVKSLCDQAGGEECLLPAMAAQALRDLTASLQNAQKGRAELQHSLMVAESERDYFRSRANFFREVAEVGNKFISVEGFKAFRGTMRITPKAAVPAYDLHGDWLYKPDTKCWYGKGSSFPEDICTIMEVMQ